MTSQTCLKASVSFAKSVRTIFDGMDLGQFSDAPEMRRRLKSKWTNKKVCHKNLVHSVPMTQWLTLSKMLIQSSETDIWKCLKTRNCWAKLRRNSTIWSRISKNRRSKSSPIPNTLTTRMSRMKIWKTCQFGTIIAPKRHRMVFLMIKAWSLLSRRHTDPTWTSSTRKRPSSS